MNEPVMMDLAAWLIEQIAEDEEIARQCLEAVDDDRTEYGKQMARQTDSYATVTSASHCGQDMGPRGTVETTPGRLLAECAAKRVIVEAAQAAFEAERSIRDTFGDHDDSRAKVERASYSATARAWWETLRFLAQPYADQPGFREEWTA